MIETLELPTAVQPGWDRKEPIANCYGFKASSSNLKLLFGYTTYPGGVINLWCYEQIGSTQPLLWRQFWTGLESAVDVAENLCRDMDDYLDSISVTFRRPSEDLDMDDFLHHLHLRVTNGFH